MKVYSRLVTDQTSSGLFAYPNCMVVCGEPIFHDSRKDVLIFPSLDSLAALGRERKKQTYSLRFGIHKRHKRHKRHERHERKYPVSG